jgi:hypothetical protein
MGATEHPDHHIITSGATNRFVHVNRVWLNTLFLNRAIIREARRRRCDVVVLSPNPYLILLCQRIVIAPWLDEVARMSLPNVSFCEPDAQPLAKMSHFAKVEAELSRPP